MEIAIDFLPIVMYVIFGFIVFTLIGHILGRTIE